MTEWFVKYLDLETNRETASRRLPTRDHAITLARHREQERCVIRWIVGPEGEEAWVGATLDALHR
jgi:hypothetical protein